MKNSQFYFNDPNAPKPNRPNHIGTCAIILYKGKILMDRRNDCDHLGLIGGALELTETLEECIMREIKEETGLCISPNMLEFLETADDPSRIIAYPDGKILRSLSAVYKICLLYPSQSPRDKRQCRMPSGA
jgi:ADP-ribose pyrophosphatase YjhB (NUDIX family)